jgi:tRNA1(Val) A37 N6-methylase TrmN6
MFGGKITNEKIMTASKIKDISKEEADEDYNKLLEAKPTKDIMTKNYGNKYLDFYFFPYRLDTLSKRNINFYDFYKNKSLQSLPSIKRLLKYKDEKGLNKFVSLYTAFQVYYGSINQFKPTIAKYIYNLFKPNTILDFSAGWGGRMLGAVVFSNIKYIGIDTNIDLKKPYKKIINDLDVKDRVKIIFKDSSKVDYSSFSYDMVFTSPPYYTLEKYENMPKYKDKNDWNEKFLFPTIYNTYKYLKKDGVYALNIPKDIYNDVKTILGKSSTKIKLSIKKRNLSKKNLGKDYTEYIYVWFK